MKTIDKHLVFMVILWENAWKMRRSRARVKYRITFSKTSYILAFSWSRKTIEKHHVFTAFTVSNSVGKRLQIAAFARSGKLRSRKTIKNHYFFMAFTISNFVKKRLENVAFARTRKLQKMFRRTRYTLAFSWSRKQSTNILFSWHSLLIIL